MAELAPAPAWDALAVAISAAETQQRALWQERFLAVLQERSFLPSRQILYACSADAPPTACMASCCAMRPMADSLQGAFDALQYSVLCLQAGCDVAVDFSSVYPARWSGFAQDHVLVGPSAFAQLWRVARELLGNDQGHSGDVALTLRCDHPDIELFIDALSSHALAPHLHCGVLVSDAFMQAVEQGQEWPLLFPLRGGAVPQGASVCERVWAGCTEPEPCLVVRSIHARALWVRLLQAQYMYAAPRLLFVDHMQRANNWWYGERPFTSSPSGHVPLGVDGMCMGGTIQLTRLLHGAAVAHPQLDWDRLRVCAATAVRFLDDACEVSAWPQKRLAHQAQASRRLGLGVSGLPALFSVLGLHHDSPAALELGEKIMRTIRDAAYEMSIDLAREKGAFGACDPLRHGAAALVLDLPHALQDGIAGHGIRNSHLLAVELTARDMQPGQQLQLAARLQSCVDSAVSVTIQVPKSSAAITFESILRQAWTLRLKNCLVRRSA